MPSLGEAPSGGAEAFCLLLRFSKVSRCKSGTASGRTRKNGYVPNPTTKTHAKVLAMTPTNNSDSRNPCNHSCNAR